jgi:DNA-binding response OmpR family regulator
LKTIPIPEILRFVLEENGASVVATDAVDKAILEFQRIQPDAVVADLGFPECNGFALIAKIREIERHTRSRSKCIAVTGFATTADRDTALKSGYDAYIAKPFEPAELVKTVAVLPA